MGAEGAEATRDAEQLSQTLIEIAQTAAVERAAEDDGIRQYTFPKWRVRDKHSRVWFDLRIDGVDVRSMLDGGAQSTMMDAEVWKKFFCKFPLRDTRTGAYGLYETKLKIIGEAWLPIKWPDNEWDFKYRFLICEGLGYPALVGDDMMVRYGINCEYPERQIYLKQDTYTGIHKILIPTYSLNLTNGRFEKLDIPFPQPPARYFDIAAHHLTPLPIPVNLEHCPEGSTVMVDPGPGLTGQCELVAGRSASRVVNGKVFLPVFNTTGATLTVVPDSTMATVHTDVEMMEDDDEEVEQWVPPMSK
jgi:hypothetical protein